MKIISSTVVSDLVEDIFTSYNDVRLLHATCVSNNEYVDLCSIDDALDTLFIRIYALQGVCTPLHLFDQEYFMIAKATNLLNKLNNEQ